MAPNHSAPESIEHLFEEALDASRRNELARAERLYDAILMRRPSMPAAQHYLGLVLHRRGLHEKARNFLEKAQRQAPDQAEFLQNHARVLIEQGRAAEALPLLEHLCALRPDAPDAIQALVNALAGLGRRQEAADTLENWLARHPGEHRLWLLAGDLRLHENAYESALQAWELARQGSPELHEAVLLRMGSAHLQRGDTAAARRAFEDALARNPDSADAHYGLATAAAHSGDFATLRREALETLRLDPRRYPAWYQLTLSPDNNQKETANDMRAAVARAGDDPGSWLLHMALGRMLEQCGCYDEAFAAFAEAHSRRAQAISLDYSEEQRHFADVRNCLGVDFVRRQPGAETDGFRPIFIVGMPRSGTTLVEAIVGAHPLVAAGGEMYFLHDWLRRNMGAVPDRMTPTWLAKADDPTLARLAQDWRGFLEKAGKGRGRVTDKFPLNFFLLGLIAVIFPDADIVHVRRDPLDTCVSCYMTAFPGRGLPAKLADLGAYYREYEALMEHWRGVLGKERIVEVEYEKLVHTSEPAARELLAALGLDWRPECLSFHESVRPVATASLYQVRQPIYASSIGRWRRFEPHLLPLLEALAGRSPQ